MGNGAAPKRLRRVRLRGTPREIGRKHGEAAAEAIGRNVALYLRRFEAEGGIDRGEALRRGALYFDVSEERAPEYAEMVRGIAEGSGLPLEEIATLNARYEILYSEFSRSLADGCSAFAALADATSDGHARLGQNWDWIPDVEGLLLDIETSEGMRVLGFTEAGVAGPKIGLNSAGIGLAINGMMSTQDDWSRLKTPFHMRTWQILTSRTLDEALAGLLNEERACSANFLIGQQLPGDAARVVNVEAAPLTAGQTEVVAGTFAHTNHFLDPQSLSIEQPHDPLSSTYARCGRMTWLLAEHTGHLDAARLATILADHDGYPYSICAHSDPSWPEEERYGTALSAIVDLTAGEVLVAAGNPCENEFVRYGLE
jgi:isopenicillin-N N-acyltransferase like protein